jgi:Arc/MetJ-type ribon-helix-helix transcriptional regulator
MSITVKLGEELEIKLRRRIARGDMTLSEFVRGAVAQRLEREPPARTAYELGKHVFGKYSSGKDDLARNHKKYLREKLRAKHGR